MMKRKNCTDGLPVIITATVIATLAVAAAAAAGAYILYERCRSLRSAGEDLWHCVCDKTYEPLVPDDDELEI